MINYQLENNLSIQEFIDVLRRSTLAERRPVDNIDKIKGMLEHANLIITARCEGKLVGVGRSISDFSFCTYMSDLAVDQDFQKQGIGTAIIHETKIQAPMAKLILLAAPAAKEYYGKIGMTHHAHCFTLDDVTDLL